MCNHYRNLEKQMREWAAIERASFADFDKKPAEDLWPRRLGYVVRQEKHGRVVDTATWGVPLTLKGKRPGTTTTKYITNVRNLTSPFWRSTLANPPQRCLVPFTEFAEPKQGREEYWFSIPSRPVAAFAGIWRESDIGRVFAFLTCEPNALVAPRHPKAMPVILPEECYDAWLAGDDPQNLAVPFPSQLMAVKED
ncbi:SOS response-associated peptidase family protein [Aurantiacibacter sp. D1-12]|uniref:SOS response-associated peptidase family protein n=1 Tax=Aurantiacibacter sp. D1-12 TaxID=2993658 RepID=UPI00237D060B|nr:SOS response-associated peptidase family protein [Aurantiacibacter sp. D1-12]MDE1467937.1 SOS response-associated peptidase family protein [Aurantiacibacter sp. D1-12]